LSYSNNIELLAPAGSKEALDAAIGEGADAVYLGLKEFNARQRTKNFSYGQFEAIIEKVHSLNKKIYVALNTIFEDREAKRIYNILFYLNIIKPDGIIIQDLGLVRFCNEFFPDLKLHASTQMNVSSSMAVNLLSKYGIKRAVLSRELSFSDIKNIRLNTNAELEIFVHGALCISLSGACLFSSYLGGKSSNRGMCAQPCRRLYRAETKKGYFFSPNDLILLSNIPDIIDTGINSIKIEGRMRSAEYVATVVSAYRYLIDNYINDKESAVKKAQDIISNDFARSKTSYYFLDKKPGDLLNPSGTAGTGIFLGKINEIKYIDNIPMALIKTNYDIDKNDTVRIHSKDDTLRESIKVKEVIRKNNKVLINITNDFSINDTVYLISKKESKKKYPSIIPKALNKYKRHPGDRNIPEFIKREKVNTKFFHSGIYLRISRFKDIYIAQSIKTDGIIIDFTFDNIKQLISQIDKIKFNTDDIIIRLDPFYPEKDKDILSEYIDLCHKKKIKKFILNNIGHINYFKENDYKLICGDYLYTFNRYSIDFYNKLGIKYFINPVENNKKNLYLSTKEFNRDNWFIIIFSFPELFQIETNIFKEFNLNKIIDKTENEYYVYILNNKTVVLPEAPFSLIDKTAQLKKDGFNKFIIDLAHFDLKKNFLKTIIRHYNIREPLKGITRFNWKNGFYRQKNQL